jgi:hypothetical protein
MGSDCVIPQWPGRTSSRHQRHPSQRRRTFPTNSMSYRENHSSCSAPLVAINLHFTLGHRVARRRGEEVFVPTSGIDVLTQTSSHP